MKKTHFILLFICLVPFCLIFWFWKPFKFLDSYKENSEWKVLESKEKKEKCFELLLGEKLIYSFISSSEVSFSIDILDTEIKKNLLIFEKTKFEKDILVPKNNGKFCLAWTNLGLNEISLNYNTQKIIVHDENMIPVNYRISEDNNSIEIINGSGDFISKILFLSKIVNFTINSKSSIIGISLANQKNNLKIYDLKEMKIIKSFKMEISPRFLEFSDDDRFIVLGNEHSNEIKRIELKTGYKKSMTLPQSPIAFFVDENPNEILVRTEKEVLKIKIEPMELLERNARIELVFGDEKILVDPEELCTVHGIPHPLFNLRQNAMSREGLSGYFHRSNL